MKPRYIMTSLTRIADLNEVPFTVEPYPREQWSEGDYTAVRVTGAPNKLYRFETISGRSVEVMPGDYAISALGTRAATLEGAGSWREVGNDNVMNSLTGAGLLGMTTSASRLLPPFMTVDYVGHVMRNGRQLNMKDFVEQVEPAELQVPVILLVGTSMSAGKTSTGRLIIHELKRFGLKVAGAKFTGAARYHDILSFQDAGADNILDFVDVGLPSTVVSPEEFRPLMQQMMARIAALDVDVLVAEAGASPLEPYNGSTAVQLLLPRVKFTVLCAFDPYSVVGVMKAFGLKPDLVAGPAAATTAAIDLVRRLTGLPAVDNLDPDAGGPMQQHLRAAIPELFE
ncbi:MAG: NAD-dependent epimerase/dehydratase family protein [Gammaproteobacteria bacterium]|nr:NAD-dependent epimerase/dehydratase family protein [Gammaproteobacteria bacterium]